jgi:sporulation protein YlmC with PRC-barrel domain
VNYSAWSVQTFVFDVAECAALDGVVSCLTGWIPANVDTLLNTRIRFAEYFLMSWSVVAAVEFIGSGMVIAASGLTAAREVHANRYSDLLRFRSHLEGIVKVPSQSISIQISRRNIMKKLTTTFIASMAMLTLAGSVYAAGDETRTSDVSQPIGATQSQSAQELLGMDIISQTGEDLGTIKDLTIDTQSGRVKYVTITKGGVLGVGGKEGIPVPLGAFEFDKDTATLAVDKSKLDTAPQRADMADENFQRELETHYGVSPSWQQDPQQHMGNDPQHQMDMEKGKMDMKKDQPMEGQKNY